MTWAYVQTFLALLFVLLLMGGIVYALRRWVLNPRNRTNERIPIEVLGSRMLQPKVYVYVLKVENKTIVLGVSDRNLQILTEVEPESHDSSIDRNIETYSNAAPSFLQYLKKNLGFVRLPSSGSAREKKVED